MSDANRVLWSEGLFLRTQHFQQQDRFFEAMARGALQAGQLHTFGFRSLTLDPALLEAGQVSVLSARGIFPDGTPFAIPETMDAPQTAGGHRRHRRRSRALALPLEPPGGVGFDPAHAEPTGARYRGRIVSVRDAVQGGSDPRRSRSPGRKRCCLRPASRSAATPRCRWPRSRALRADGGVALDETLPAADAGHRRRGLVRAAAAGGDHRARPHRRGAWQDGARRPRAQRRGPADAQSRQCGPTAAGPHAGAGRLPSGRALPGACRPRRRDGDLRLQLAPAGANCRPTITWRPARPIRRWPTRCAR